MLGAFGVVVGSQGEQRPKMQEECDDEEDEDRRQTRRKHWKMVKKTKKWCSWSHEDGLVGKDACCFGLMSELPPAVTLH